MGSGCEPSSPAGSKGKWVVVVATCSLAGGTRSLRPSLGPPPQKHRGFDRNIFKRAPVHSRTTTSQPPRVAHQSDRGSRTAGGGVWGGGWLARWPQRLPRSGVTFASTLAIAPAGGRGGGSPPRHRRRAAPPAEHCEIGQGGEGGQPAARAAAALRTTRFCRPTAADGLPARVVGGGAASVSGGVSGRRPTRRPSAVAAAAAADSTRSARHPRSPTAPAARAPPPPLPARLPALPSLSLLLLLLSSQLPLLV